MKILHFEQLGSTNTYLKELALNRAVQHGDAVLADSQTAGHGRVGRVFYSKGGIYLSVYLALAEIKIPFSAITCASAVAVNRALNDLSVDTSIKWVNDLLLDGKKLCGILCEAVTSIDGELLGVVVGVGINFAKDPITFPDGIKESACAVVGTSAQRDQLIQAAIRKICLYAAKEFEWIGIYRSENCVIGHRISILPFSSTPYEAEAIDVDENGSLIVQLDTGEKRKITSGEVSIRAI